jgi:hypothetical protein
MKHRSDVAYRATNVSPSAPQPVAEPATLVALAGVSNAVGLAERRCANFMFRPDFEDSLRTLLHRGSGY